MTAYVIVIRDKTKDAAKLESYNASSRAAAAPDLELLAGRGELQVLEGPHPESVVILRFPNTAAARNWYNSNAYQKALTYAKDAVDRRVLLVEGAS